MPNNRRKTNTRRIKVLPEIEFAMREIIRVTKVGESAHSPDNHLETQMAQILEVGVIEKFVRVFEMSIPDYMKLSAGRKGRCRVAMAPALSRVVGIDDL